MGPTRAHLHRMAVQMVAVIMAMAVLMGQRLMSMRVNMPLAQDQSGPDHHQGQ